MPELARAPTYQGDAGGARKPAPGALASPDATIAIGGSHRKRWAPKAGQGRPQARLWHLITAQPHAIGDRLWRPVSMASRHMPISASTARTDIPRCGGSDPLRGAARPGATNRRPAGGSDHRAAGRLLLLCSAAAVRPTVPGDAGGRRLPVRPASAVVAGRRPSYDGTTVTGREASPTSVTPGRYRWRQAESSRRAILALLSRHSARRCRYRARPAASRQLPVERWSPRRRPRLCGRSPGQWGRTVSGRGAIRRERQRRRLRMQPRTADRASSAGQRCICARRRTSSVVIAARRPLPSPTCPGERPAQPGWRVLPRFPGTGANCWVSAHNGILGRDARAGASCAASLISGLCATVSTGWSPDGGEPPALTVVRHRWARVGDHGGMRAHRHRRGRQRHLGTVAPPQQPSNSTAGSAARWSRARPQAARSSAPGARPPATGATCRNARNSARSCSRMPDASACGPDRLDTGASTAIAIAMAA